MMRLYMRTNQGEVICRVKETSLASLIERLENNNWLETEDPVSANVIQSPIVNDKGEIQMTDGSWIPQNMAGRAGVENIMMRNVLRMAPFGVDEFYVRANEIVQVRELTDDETAEYNKAIQSSKLATSGLTTATTSIELPEDLKNDA